VGVFFSSYEWRYSTSDDPTEIAGGKNTVKTITDVIPNVTYVIEYRLVTPSGIGNWLYVNVNGIEKIIYIWYVYADDENGSGISLDPSNKEYFGILGNRSGPTPNLSDPTIFDYYIQPVYGASDGDGITASLTNEAHVISTDDNGLGGDFSGATSRFIVLVGKIDGTASYTLSTLAGAGISGNLSGTTYTVTNMTADTGTVTFTATRDGFPTLIKVFTLSKSKSGGVGSTGPTGDQGIPGASSYFHIAYANSANGSVGFNQNSGSFVGTYVDSNPTDSSNYTSYSWQQFVGSQGPNGNQGIKGNTGSNGQTSYLHIAYANNSNGSSGFTTGNWTNQTYIGTYVDFNVADSTNAGSYDWKLFKGSTGNTGPQGNQGITGPQGNQGASSYFHIAYANSANGSVGFNQNSGSFVGTYVDSNPTDSSNYTSYSWQQFVGSQGPNGNQGIPGDEGDSGQTSYLHIAYADNSSGSSNFTTGNWTNQTYIGTYVDFNVADSTNASLYDWKLFKGETGGAGEQGPTGPPGSSNNQIRASGDVVLFAPNDPQEVCRINTTEDSSPLSTGTGDWKINVGFSGISYGDGNLTINLKKNGSVISTKSARNLSYSYSAVHAGSNQFILEAVVTGPGFFDVDAEGSGYITGDPD
jgi:hypothetical protein